MTFVKELNHVTQEKKLAAHSFINVIAKTQPTINGLAQKDTRELFSFTQSLHAFVWSKSTHQFLSFDSHYIPFSRYRLEYNVLPDA